MRARIDATRQQHDHADGRLPRSRWRPERGTWEARGTGRSFPGSLAGCPQLSVWGPATRAMLAVALWPLHQEEDQLRAALGQAPRTRPDLPAVGPPVTTPRTALAAQPQTALRPGQWEGEPIGVR